MTLPILNYRYMVVTEGLTSEFALQRNALRYLRRSVEATHAAQYEVTLTDTTQVYYPSLDAAMDRVKSFIGKRRVGERIRVRALDAQGDPLTSGRIWVTARYLQPADTPGVPNIDLVVAAVDEFWPKRRYAGICVCKPNSDHRDCAAVDWFDTNESMAAARDYFIDNYQTYGIKYIILFDRIYSDRYGFSARPYVGTYHAHVHISVYGGIPGAACG